MSCSQYTLNAPGVFIYRGSAGRPGEGSRYAGCLGVDLLNDLLEMYDGSGWKTVLQPFTGQTVAYTPSLYVATSATEVTYGTTGASRTGRIAYTGSVLEYWGQITFGLGLSFPAAGHAFQLTFPFYPGETAALPALAIDMAVGNAMVFDLNVATRFAAVAFLSEASGQTRLSFASMTSASASATVTSTSPMTWAAGDSISWSVSVPLL